MDFIVPDYSSVVLQPTTFCNINCRYCYLYDRKVNNVIDFSILDKLASELKLHKKSHVSVIWHGGEPLTIGKEKFTHCLSYFDELVSSGMVTHEIQTNAILIDQEWCDIFRNNYVRVGVSIDGPPDFNKSRVTWSGKPTYERAVKGINALKDNSIPFSAIAVITSESIHHLHG